MKEELEKWDVLTKNLTEGSILEGHIVRIEDYGVFLEIEQGLEGLIRVPEVSWKHHPINLHETFKIDQICEAKVINIDPLNREIFLSIKQLTQNPWTEIEKHFAIGSCHNGHVIKLTPYGVFVELTEYIGGMILIYQKQYNYIFKIGDSIAVEILDIDKINRKLYLGCQ